MWNEKTKKEVINREICKKRLGDKLKPLIPLTAFLSVWAIIETLITVGIMGDFISVLFKKEVVNGIDIFWCVLYVLMLAVPMLVMDALAFILILKLVKGYYKISKGHFYAVEDVLDRKARGERMRFPNTNFLVGRRLDEDAFYFLNMGRYEEDSFQICHTQSWTRVQLCAP